MTTLLDNELFEYLGHLESEIDDRISTSSDGSLQHLMHSQMRDLIGSERQFLQYVNQNGTQSVLSISPNGLPSVDSLNPDLEKICELAEDESLFVDISQRFLQGVNGIDMGENKHLYVPVSEEKWNEELKNKNGTELQSKVGFKINETDDGKFELAVREYIHLQSYDQYSRDFPILTREGRMRYHVVWNKLIDDAEESFYVSNIAITLRKENPLALREKFGDEMGVLGVVGFLALYSVVMGIGMSN